MTTSTTAGRSGQPRPRPAARSGRPTPARRPPPRSGGSGRQGRQPAPRRRVADRDRAPRARTKTKRTQAAEPAVRPLVPMVLGLLWAVLLVAAVSLGSTATAIVLIPVGVVATVSAVRAATAVPAPPARRRKAGGRDPSGKRTRPRIQRGPLVSAPVVLGASCAVVLPLVALGGALPAVVVAALAVVAAGVALMGGRRTGSSLSLLIAIFAPAIATMSVALARNQGSSVAVTFVAAICLYDMGGFVVGSGRGALGGLPGVAAGVLGVVILAFFVAAVMDPPFSGVRPWILFGVLAAAAPTGVWLASRVAPHERLPALRRLDSLMLSGPAWVIGVAILLHQ